MSNRHENEDRAIQKPDWLRVTLPHGSRYEKIRKLVRDKHLNTVCDKARCPNISECWSKGTATFIILGQICTRNCRFCAVQTGQPIQPDREEPLRIAQAVYELRLKHAVITSVTRDDLPDGGATLFAETIEQIRKLSPSCTVEVLIPDFLGHKESLEQVLQARPDLVAHNLETVPRLYAKVLPGASYQRSLNILNWTSAIDSRLHTKSGLMLGMGESRKEVRAVMKDLAKTGCRILTLGQYLSPGKKHYPVIRYITPKSFEELKEEALSLGFLRVESGPLVRSSYKAEALFPDSRKEVKASPPIH